MGDKIFAKNFST